MLILVREKRQSITIRKMGQILMTITIMKVWGNQVHIRCQAPQEIGFLHSKVNSHIWGNSTSVLTTRKEEYLTVTDATGNNIMKIAIIKVVNKQVHIGLEAQRDMNIVRSELLR